MQPEQKGESGFDQFPSRQPGPDKKSNQMEQGQNGYVPSGQPVQQFDGPPPFDSKQPNYALPPNSQLNSEQFNDPSRYEQYPNQPPPAQQPFYRQFDQQPPRGGDTNQMQNQFFSGNDQYNQPQYPAQNYEMPMQQPTMMQQPSLVNAPSLISEQPQLSQQPSMINHQSYQQPVQHDPFAALKDMGQMYHVHQPTFSTLNMDVIPDNQYLKAIENHEPQFDTQMLKELCKQAGMKTTDERIYKIMSVMMEDKLTGILDEVNAMQAQSQQAKEQSSVHQQLQQLKQDNQQFTDQQLRTHLKDQQQQIPKTVLQFEDLRNALQEFDVVIRKPAFVEDKLQNKYAVEKPVPLKSDENEIVMPQDRKLQQALYLAENTDNKSDLQYNI